MRLRNEDVHAVIVDEHIVAEVVHHADMAVKLDAERIPAHSLLLVVIGFDSMLIAVPLKQRTHMVQPGGAK